MSPEEVNAIIAEVDLDGDGKLDYSEFCQMLLSTSEECVQASHLKSAQMLKHSDHLGSQSKSPKITSLERREKRRKEIRKQLHSTDDSGALGKGVYSKVENNSSTISSVDQSSNTNTKSTDTVPDDNSPEKTGVEHTQPPLQSASDNSCDDDKDGDKSSVEQNGSGNSASTTEVEKSTSDSVSKEISMPEHALEKKTVEDEREVWQTGHLEEGQQPLGNAEGAGTEKETPKESDAKLKNPQSDTASLPASVITPPPRKPSNIETWNSITGKGCFYLNLNDENDEGIIICHHYHLKLPAPTTVWTEISVSDPGIKDTDVLLFVFRTNENEEATDTITYTEHKVDDHWVCKMDLDAGTYALTPFTSGCYLKPDDSVSASVSLISSKDGSTVLTKDCLAALEEIFHRIDLDNNGCISRTEFDFFQEVTSGELCDDEAWNIIKTNFDMTGDDEITLRGFLALHEMTAIDEEGGEEELWQVLQGLGYNRQLQLHQACPFLLEVFTEECEGEIEIVDLLPFGPVTNPALSQIVTERGVVGDIEGRDEGEELTTYTFNTPHLTTIVVENKSSKTAHVQLDCSHSVNCLTNRESSVHVLEVEALSKIIGYYLQPENVQAPYHVNCIASKILA